MRKHILSVIYILIEKIAKEDEAFLKVKQRRRNKKNIWIKPIELFIKMSVEYFVPSTPFF